CRGRAGDRRREGHVGHGRAGTRVSRRAGALAGVLAAAALALAACGRGGDDTGGGAGTGGSGSGGTPTLTVSAAASLQQAFTAYGRRFTAARARFSFAGSDELAAQIRQGVKPDVYAAANAKLP